MTSPTLIMSQEQINEDRAAWQKVRQQSIGASEIGILVGVAPSNHGNALSLYTEKVTGKSTFDGASDELERGTALEPYVEGKLLKIRPDLRVYPGGLYASAEYPWMTATFDGLAASKEQASDRASLLGTAWHLCSKPVREELARLLTPVEIKTAYTRDPLDGWGEAGSDEVPVQYKAQAYWQMVVWDTDTVIMPVQFMVPWRTVVYVLHRTPQAETDIKFMITEGLEFMDRVERRDPPPLDWTPSSTGALLTLNPMRPDMIYRASPTAAKALRAAYLRMKDRERRYKLLQNKLIARAKGAQRIVIEDPERPGKDVTVLSRAQYDHPWTDVEALQAEEPEVYQRFRRTTPVDKVSPGQRWMKL